MSEDDESPKTEEEPAPTPLKRWRRGVRAIYRTMVITHVVIGSIVAEYEMVHIVVVLLHDAAKPGVAAGPC